MTDLEPERELTRFITAYMRSLSVATTHAMFEPTRMHPEAPMPPPTRFVRRKRMPSRPTLKCEVSSPKATDPKCNPSSVAGVSPVRIDSYDEMFAFVADLTSACARCGREGHTELDCVAMDEVNGKYV